MDISYENNNFIRDAVINFSSPTNEVEKLRIKNKDYFGNFYTFFLDFYQQRLFNTLENASKENNLKLNKQKIISSALEAFSQELIQLCIRTLIVDINDRKEKGLLEGKDSKLRYKNYNNLIFKSEYVAEILNKYPVLTYLISSRISNKILYLKEVLENLRKNRQDIYRELKIEFDEVSNIYFSSGDTHNGGKNVLIIETNQGKIVYKPHSLSPDILFNSIVDYVNNSDKILKKIYKIRTLDYKDYGYQEFIDYKECETSEKLNFYFYRVGVSLSIFHIIGCDDLHHENLIAHGEYPVVIDLETLIKNNSIYKPRNNNLIDNFHEDINYSVLGTMLLPLNLQTSIFDFDLGGISNDENQTSEIWKSYIIDFEGTDEIQLTKKSVIMNSTQNRAAYNGKAADPKDYIEEILKGFTDCYNFVLENISGFHDLVKKVGSSNLEVRQVLRATSIYARFLEASTHPNYLSSFEERKELFKKINIAEGVTDKFSKKNLYELESLMCNDVPYFSTMYNSLDLICNKSTSIVNFFREGLLDVVLNKIKSISKASLKKQQYYIRMSLTTTIKDSWKRTNIHNKKYRPKLFGNNNKNYLECATEIGDLFLETAIWNNDRSKCTWVTPIISENNKVKLGPLNFDLYEGGGVILFLALLGKENGKKEYFDLALAGMRGIEELFLSNDKMDGRLSLFTGIGSLSYIYYHLYTYTNDYKYYEKFKKYIKKINEMNISGDIALDIVGGVSSLIVFLLNLYKETKLDILNSVCCKLGNTLYQCLENDKHNYLTGLSHGYSGFTWALCYLGHITKEEKYTTLGKELLKIENKFFDLHTSNWKDLRGGEGNSDPVYWCHGAGGIALSRAFLKDLLKNKENVVDKEIDKEVDRDLSSAICKLLSDGFKKITDHSLCHGSFGNIDILLKLSEFLNDIDLQKVAFKEAQNAINYIRDKGFIPGLQDHFDLNTFMLGLGGVGYSLLRLHNPVNPSLLAMEVRSYNE